jgi:maltose alpha-D-glucosyltransferase/alpha-amylase
MARLIRRRRESPEFGWGAVTLLETQSPSLFAHRCDWEGSTVVAVHNLGEARTEATITLDDDVLAIDDMLEAREHEILDGGKLKARLGRYGYLWLRVRREGERKLS